MIWQVTAMDAGMDGWGRDIGSKRYVVGYVVAPNSDSARRKARRRYIRDGAPIYRMEVQYFNVGRKLQELFEDIEFFEGLVAEDSK